MQEHNYSQGVWLKEIEMTVQFLLTLYHGNRYYSKLYKIVISQTKRTNCKQSIIKTFVLFFNTR